MVGETRKPKLHNGVKPNPGVRSYLAHVAHRNSEEQDGVRSAGSKTKWLLSKAPSNVNDTKQHPSHLHLHRKERNEEHKTEDK